MKKSKFLKERKIELLLVFAILGFLLGASGHLRLFNSTSLDSSKGLTGRQFAFSRQQAEKFVKNIEAEPDWQKREQMAKELAYKAGPELAIELLNKSSIPKAGRGHLLAHRIGEAAYEIFGEDAFAFCQNDDFSGCSHGLLSLAISEIGFDGVKRMVENCNKWGTFKYNMCHHAAGHAFLALSGYDVFPALNNCDSLAEVGSMPHFHCINGLFMEEAHGEHDGMIPPLHPQLSTTDLLSPCNKVEGHHKRACYLNIAGWWLQAFGFDIKQTAGYCVNVPEKYQIDCVDNVARLISTLTNNQYEEILESCEVLRGEWSQMCLVFIAQSVSSQGDETLPYKLCQSVESEEVKHECYLKLTAGLQERYSMESAKYNELCDKFEPEYREICNQDLWNGGRTQ